MTNQTFSLPQPSKRAPLQPKQVALYHLTISAIMFIATLILSKPISGTETGINILVSISSIVLSTLIGYYLITRGRSTLGLGFVVYGLMFGLFWISFIVEGIGGFTFFSLVLITAITISTDISTKLRIYSMIISVVIGSAAFLIDINTQGASYRISLPEILSGLLWLISAANILLIGSVFFRQFPFLPFRTKIISSFVIISITSIGIIGYLNYLSVQNALIIEAREKLNSFALQSASNITNFVGTNIESIVNDGYIPVFIDYLKAPLPEKNEGSLRNQAAATLSALQGKNSAYISSYALVDLKGNVLLDSEGLEINNFEGDITYFSQVFETGQPQFTVGDFSSSQEKDYLYFSAPIREPLGEPLGIIRVRFDKKIIQEMLAASNELIGKDSFSVLIENKSLHPEYSESPELERYFLQSVFPLDEELAPHLRTENSPFIPQNYFFFELDSLGKTLYQTTNMEKGLISFIDEETSQGSREKQVVATVVDRTPWVLIFFQPLDVFLKPVGAIANSTIIFGLITASIAVGIALSLTNLLTKPITDLTESAKEVAKGNLEVQINVTTEDEIGELSSTFNIMTAQLQNLVTNLEEQVSVRTRELQNQAAQLQAAAEISRDATSEPEMEDLLSRAVNLMAERFGFSHVGIYLTDHRETLAVMMAGNGSVGDQLVSNGHRFKVSNDSNVGYVCKNGEPRIASIDNELTQISYHPLLQNSASEMVLPLKVGEKTLGAIDIHSTNPKAFSEKDIPIFQTMADQLAIAIQKIEFREEIQQTLGELETAYGRATREAWGSYIQSQNTTGYQYRHMNVEPVETNPPEVLEAWELAETIIHKESDQSEETNGSSVMAIPLKVRGGVIGVMNIQFETDQIPSDTVNLFEEITNRLSFVLENARLVESAQNRVDQELLTSDITNKMRQTLDLDTVLKTAVKEIGENLGLAEVEIRMGHIMESSTAQSSDGNANENTSSQLDEILEA